jgi:hypothetical protein
MGLFNRIRNIIKPAEPPMPEKSILTVAPGDIVEISFVTYQITGRTKNLHRNAITLTLRDGQDVRYLHIEERERVMYALYTPIDGRLESANEVPSTIEVEDTSYHLEEHYIGNVKIAGNTPFSEEGEQYVWQYQSDDRRLLRIEWQNGRFMLYEGESVLPADVIVLRGT